MLRTGSVGAVHEDGVSLVLKVVTAILPITLFASNAGAATYKVLYSFGGSPEAPVYPLAGLIMDKNGNLYGTTGGRENAGTGGTVFELSPGPDGAWTETVIHEFDGAGVYPQAGLVLDASGNLYGTTFGGGPDGKSAGEGVVFELSPAAAGTWTETVLHSFSGPDGSHPTAGLVFDGEGNLYGTTSDGGPYSYNAESGGVVFELSPAGGGKWTKAVLHDFGAGTDGSYVISGLIVDAAGNLYGTTEYGGSGGASKEGTAFELTPSEGGVWTETVLHNFGSGADGENPKAGLALDGAGNLYGETSYGGRAVRARYSSWSHSREGDGRRRLCIVSVTSAPAGWNRREA